jgi:hypothetical protein
LLCVVQATTTKEKHKRKTQKKNTKEKHKRKTQKKKTTRLFSSSRVVPIRRLPHHPAHAHRHGQHRRDHAQHRQPS